MRKYTLLSLTIAAIVLTSCRHQAVFKEVQAPGKFTIQIPEYMRATSDLFGGGKCSLQYENDSMQVYMLVFDTGRQNLNEKTLREYYDSIVSDPSVSGAHIALPKQVMVNGDSALTSEMTAVLNSVPVSYKIEVIATPLRFYYILLWCRTDKKDDLNSDFDKVLRSFNGLNHNKV